MINLCTSLSRKKDELDIVVQLLIAGLFFFVYAFFSTRAIQKGINHQFLTRCIAIFWPLFFIIIILLAAIFFFRKKTLKLEHSNAKISFFDLFLVFLPLSPIVQYVILNRNFLGFLDSVLLVFFYFVIIVIFCLAIPSLLSFFGYHRILLVLGASFCFMIFNMASFAVTFKWHLKGNLLIQALIFLGIFFVVLFFHHLNKKLLALMAAAFFLSSVASSIHRAYFERDGKKGEGERSQLLHTLTKGKEMVKIHDIFLMTYDSYVSNKTMLGYKINNCMQEEFLAQNRFHIYDDIYTIGADTFSSMDGVLEVSALVEPKGRGISGNGVVQNVLKGNGYELVGIFNNGYMFNGLKPAYNESYPKIDKIDFFSFNLSLIFKQILEGEFRFDAGFDRFVYSDFIARKRSNINRNSHFPRFIYTHSGPGHSQNSGKCLDNEIELFRKRLSETNEEMKEDILSIIQYHPGAIIIVNGDHGPYLTKNCIGLGGYETNKISRLDIQDRFGSFLAIRWPMDAHIRHEEIKILQDVFPMVFSYLFADDRILDSRISRITRDYINALPEGVLVKNGFIVGGLNDGEPLFE